MQGAHWIPGLVLAQNAPPATPPGPLDMVLQVAPLIVIGILFYVMLVLPERRKQRTHEALVNGLKKNDRVLTAGGILATVVNAPKDSNEIVLKIDENSNTRVHVLRRFIVEVVSSEVAAETKGS